MLAKSIEERPRSVLALRFHYFRHVAWLAQSSYYEPLNKIRRSPRMEPEANKLSHET